MIAAPCPGARVPLASPSATTADGTPSCAEATSPLGQPSPSAVAAATCTAAVPTSRVTMRTRFVGSSTSGASSRRAPSTTKNSGTRNPSPTPMSSCATVRGSPRAASTAPIVKPASMMLVPSSCAIQQSPNSARSESRSRRPHARRSARRSVLRSARRRTRRSPSTSSRAPVAITATLASSTRVTSPGAVAIGTAMIVAMSATITHATACRASPFGGPLAASTGITTAAEEVTSRSTSRPGRSIGVIELSRSASGTASSATRQVARTPRHSAPRSSGVRSGRCVPAMSMSRANPTCPRKATVGSLGSTQPSTLGPMATPAASSPTTRSGP